MAFARAARSAALVLLALTAASASSEAADTLDLDDETSPGPSDANLAQLTDSIRSLFPMVTPGAVMGPPPSPTPPTANSQVAPKSKAPLPRAGTTAALQVSHAAPPAAPPAARPAAALKSKVPLPRAAAPAALQVKHVASPPARPVVKAQLAPKLKTVTTQAKAVAAIHVSEKPATPVAQALSAPKLNVVATQKKAVAVKHVSSKPATSLSSKPRAVAATHVSAKPATLPASKPHAVAAVHLSAKPATSPASKPHAVAAVHLSAKPATSPSSKPHAVAAVHLSAKPATSPHATVARKHQAAQPVAHRAPSAVRVLAHEKMAKHAPTTKIVATEHKMAEAKAAPVKQAHKAAALIAAKAGATARSSVKSPKAVGFLPMSSFVLGEDENPKANRSNTSAAANISKAAAKEVKEVVNTIARTIDKVIKAPSTTIAPVAKHVERVVPASAIPFAGRTTLHATEALHAEQRQDQLEAEVAALKRKLAKDEEQLKAKSAAPPVVIVVPNSSVAVAAIKANASLVLPLTEHLAKKSPLYMRIRATKPELQAKTTATKPELQAQKTDAKPEPQAKKTDTKPAPKAATEVAKTSTPTPATAGSKKTATATGKEANAKAKKEVAKSTTPAPATASSSRSGTATQKTAKDAKTTHKAVHNATDIAKKSKPKYNPVGAAKAKNAGLKKVHKGKQEKGAATKKTTSTTDAKPVQKTASTEKVPAAASHKMSGTAQVTTAPPAKMNFASKVKASAAARAAHATTTTVPKIQAHARSAAHRAQVHAAERQAHVAKATLKEKLAAIMDSTEVAVAPRHAPSAARVKKQVAAKHHRTVQKLPAHVPTKALQSHKQAPAPHAVIQKSASSSPKPLLRKELTQTHAVAMKTVRAQQATVAPKRIVHATAVQAAPTTTVHTSIEDRVPFSRLVEVHAVTAAEVPTASLPPDSADSDWAMTAAPAAFAATAMKTTSTEPVAPAEASTTEAPALISAEPTTTAPASWWSSLLSWFSGPTPAPMTAPAAPHRASLVSVHHMLRKTPTQDQALTQKEAVDDRYHDVQIEDAWSRQEDFDNSDVEELHHEDEAARSEAEDKAPPQKIRARAKGNEGSKVSSFWKSMETEDGEIEASLDDKDLTKFEALTKQQSDEVTKAAAEAERGARQAGEASLLQGGEHGSALHTAKASFGDDSYGARPIRDAWEDQVKAKRAEDWKLQMVQLKARHALQQKHTQKGK